MKKQIVEYITFTSNKEFVKWQETQINIRIINVIPIVNNFKNEDINKVNADVTYGIFIAYVSENGE